MTKDILDYSLKDFDNKFKDNSKFVSSIYTLDRTFVAKYCPYFKEYCVFQETIENVPLKFKNKIPSGMAGVEFPSSGSRDSGVYEYSKLGLRFYQRENTKKKRIKNEFKKALNDKFNEIQIKKEKLKPKSKKHADYDKELKDYKEALDKRRDELLKEIKDKSPLFKPNNWHRLFHFKTYDECVKFLETLGYVF